TVMTNQDRRSYQKIITKECKVLKSLRKEREISQDKASALCGYSRPAIGHIENGRIELDRERIEHIVQSYGFEMGRFIEALKMDEQRDEVVELCLERIKELNGSKLEIVKNFLATF
ncbi:MAG: helix-turn-helix transcriptional regulator, partial [Bacteriovoracaceae bacterium]|nr:helix-turn-helix transcriptional regulator [Bacteriovoracaceae bacterium]